MVTKADVPQIVQQTTAPGVEEDPKWDTKLYVNWQYICLELSEMATSYYEQLKRINKEFHTRHNNSDIEAEAPRNPG